MHHPTDRIAHNTAFVTPVVGHWLEGEIAQWVGKNEDIGETVGTSIVSNEDSSTCLKTYQLDLC